jgi:hypothetical protein
VTEALYSGCLGETVKDPSFRGLFRFIKSLLYSRAKAVGKQALKTGSNILTDILEKQPERPMGNIFKTRFGEAKDNLQQKN